jgi:hypothetical protein
VLLTVAELREHVTTALGDDALERLLDAAEQAIATIAGPVGDLTEIRDGGGSYIFLPRPASEIDTVTEWLGYSSERALDEDDYSLRSDGISLRRLTTGPNASAYWVGPVEVVYTPLDDVAARQAVQLALVRLFLDHHPGVTSESIGDWSETFASNSVWNYALERDGILATLRAPALGFA